MGREGREGRGREGRNERSAVERVVSDTGCQVVLVGGAGSQSMVFTCVLLWYCIGPMLSSSGTAGEQLRC